MKTNQLQKNIPDGWQEIKLADIGDFKNGVNKSKEDFGHGSPFVNLMDIFGFSSIKHKKFSLVNVSDNELENYNLKKGDILFVRSSVKPEGVGLATLVEEDLKNTVYSGFIIRFRTKNKLLVDEFKKFVFQSPYFRNNLIASSSVSANTNINQDSLNKLTIKFPSIEEQYRIISVLETWEKSVEKLAKKIELKKQIKKGLMQDLLTGKKRLKGFSDKWEVCMMDSLVSILKNGVPKFEGLKKYYSTSAVLDNNKIDLISYENRQSRANMYPSLNDIAIAKMKGTNRCFVIDDNLIGSVFSTGFLFLRPKNDIDYSFVYYIVSNNKFQYFKDLYSSSGIMGGIGNKEFLSIEVKIPKFKEEQSAIAQILTTADKEIIELERKLQIIKEQKRYLLNNLITGTIRTPETLSAKLTK